MTNLLNEREQRARARGDKPPRGVPQKVLVVKPPEESHCSYCYAEPGEPCIKMKGKNAGEIRDEYHAYRDEHTWEPRFEGDGNELTDAGKAHEQAMAGLGSEWTGSNPDDRLRYDPLDSQRLPEEGGYVTFLGQQQGVAGAYSTFMEPGHTFYAQHAPKTEDGFDKYGQYKVYFETPEGPVYLFPYEYVRLSPQHLLYLVKENVLNLHAKGHAPERMYEQVHYLQSRGIHYEDAVLMVMGEDQANIGWFEPLVDWDGHRWKLESVGMSPAEKQDLLNALTGELHA